MPFNKGSVTYRAYHSPLPAISAEGAAKRLMGEPPAPEANITDAVQYGYARTESVYNLELPEAVSQDRLHASFVASQRKIDKVRFDSEVADATRATKKARNLEFLSKKETTEIRQEVHNRLLPLSPVVRKPNPFLYTPAGLVDGATRRVTMYASPLSDTQVDDFSTMWNHATKGVIRAMYPDTEAVDAVDTFHQIDPAAFAPGIDTEAQMDDVGADFLTWLLYHHANDMKWLPFDVGILGPLAISSEDTTVSVSGDLALRDTAAVTALKAGKKVTKLRFHAVVAGSTLAVGVDNTFAFRGMRIELADNALDEVSEFDARFDVIDQFTHGWYDAFARFVRLRASDKWVSQQIAVRQWVKDLRGSVA